MAIPPITKALGAGAPTPKVPAPRVPAPKAPPSAVVPEVRPAVEPVVPVVDQVPPVPPTQEVPVAAVPDNVPPESVTKRMQAWMADPANKDGVMKYLSQHDWLKIHAGKELADKLFRNAPENVNFGSAQATTWLKNAGDEELRLVHEALDKYTGMNSLRTVLGPFKRREAIKQRVVLEDAAYRHLVDSYYREGQGLPLIPHKDPRVQDIVDTYRNSKFATNSLKRQRDSGIDVNGIQESDNYVPVHWEHHKIARFTRNAESNIDSVAEAFGKGIARQFPRLVDEKGLSYKQLGRAFLRTQEDAVRNTSSTPFHGTTVKDIQEILKNAGVEPQEINQVIEQVTPNLKDAGKLKNHKSRIAFDIEEVHFTPDGRHFRLGDFMRTNLGSQLDKYNNLMAHRAGLAQVGIPDETTLRTLFNDVAQKYEGDPVKHREVQDMLEVMFNDVMGRPTGAAMHDNMRSGATLAQSLFLFRSGLYNLVEYNKSAATFGYAKVMQKFLPAFKDTLKSQPITPGVARRLDEVISGRLIGEGRLRSVINLTEDNFDGAVTLSHEWIRAAGQTTKFLNISEFLRRQHINLVTGIQADYLNTLHKVDLAGSLVGEAADAKKYLNTIGITDDMIKKVQKEMDANGLYTELWKDQDLADKLGIMLSSSVDDFAMMVRRGELPAVLSYSVVGKVLFPFFTFTAATNQKILRQSYNAGGVSGVAVMFAHQAPLAVMVAAAANVMDGKEWDEDLLKRAVGIAPGIGYGALGYSALDRGEVGSTPTVWALPNAIGNLSSGIAEGDVHKIIKNVPGLSASPVVQTLNNALKD